MRNEELEQIVREELEELVIEVLEKQDRIIPIIGDECFIGLVDNNNESSFVPLQQWITEELLGSHSSYEVKQKIASQGYHGLDLLFDEYERISPRRKGFLHFKNKISFIIDEGINNSRLRIRSDVKDFLCAGNFDVIVTTCPYNILQKELNMEGKNYNVFSFAPHKVLTNGSRSEATLELPAIYQLFGNYRNEFVSGEGTLLKFLHYLNQTDTEKGYGASQLVKYIKDKGLDNKGLGLLMPIGCNNLPNWIFRFLWYPFCLDRLNGHDSDNQGGVWHKYSNDESFYSFLDKYNFRTFSESTDFLNSEDIDGDPVLKRLTKEFLLKADKVQNYISSELQVQHLQDGERDIFVSYASEDLELAQKVYDILTIRCSQKVWMDRRGRIQPGDEYWDAIQHGIEHSQRYLFLITEEYLRKAIGKNYIDDTGIPGQTGVYKEIDLIRHHILNKRKDGQKGNIIPLIVEGTTVTYTDINKMVHQNEPLCNALLEKLPYFEEYALMQTHDLFKQVEGILCNDSNIDERLTNIFNDNNQ